MRDFYHHSSIKSLIQHFTPNWFAVNMGTGITALCVGSLPINIAWIHAAAIGMWMFNSLLFFIFFTCWLTSIIAFPKAQLSTLKHSTVPFFLGCLPMGLITVVNGFILFGMSLFGHIALIIAQFLWGFDAILSVAVVVVVPYFMFIHQKHEISSTTAIWLLPCVPAEVAAASAGNIALHLGAASGETFIILGYILWGISLPLAFVIIALFIQRLILYKLPAPELGATIWLLLGPIGTGAFGMLTLGASAAQLSQNLHYHWMSILYSVGLMGSIILLGFGTWIILMATLLTIRYIVKGIPYNMSFWGFTFPLGVYTMSVLTLGKLLHLTIFNIYGIFLTIALTLIWMYVAYKTLPGLVQGTLIHNPALAKNT